MLPIIECSTKATAKNDCWSASLAHDDTSVSGTKALFFITEPALYLLGSTTMHLLVLILSIRLPFHQVQPSPEIPFPAKSRRFGRSQPYHLWTPDPRNFYDCSDFLTSRLLYIYSVLDLCVGGDLGSS
jgi:hypothetical protein